MASDTAGGVQINGKSAIRVPLPLFIFMIGALVGTIVWGIRLEGRINTLTALQDVEMRAIRETQETERRERQLTTVDLQTLLQRVAKLEGKVNE